MAKVRWPIEADDIAGDLNDTHYLGGYETDYIPAGNKQRRISLLKLRTWLHGLLSDGVISPKWFGAIGDGATDDSTLVLAANVYALANNTKIDFDGGIYKVLGVTITAPIVDTGNRIFSDDSTVIIDNGGFVRPEWWGGDIHLAHDGLPSTGGEIKLSLTEYIGDRTKSFTKPIKLVGSGMPVVNSTDTQLVVGSGTIIYGGIDNESSGFEVRDLGVETTAWAVANKGITYGDSLTASGNLAGTLANNYVSYYRNIICQNIIILNITSAVEAEWGHSLRIEHADGVYVDNIYSINGYHGNVFKGRNIQGGVIRSRGQNGSTLIIKSDLWTETSRVQIDNIIVGDNQEATTSGAVIIAETRNSIDIFDIKIGNLSVENTARSFTIVNGDSVPSQISKIFVDNIYIDGGEGIVLNNCESVYLGKHHLKNTGFGMYIEGSTSNMRIGSGTAENGTNDGYRFASADLYHDLLIARNNAGYAMNNAGGLCPIDLNKIVNDGNTLGLTNTGKTLINYTNLLNGFTSVDNSFTVTQMGAKKIVISGKVTAGAGIPNPALSFAQLPAGFVGQVHLNMKYDIDTTADFGLYIDITGAMFIVNGTAGNDYDMANETIFLNN